jgi:hypothetical protein
MSSSRFFKDVPKRDSPSQAEVGRAKDFWTAVFEDSIVAQLDESSPKHGNAVDLVEFAAKVADAALIEMERRWPRI